MLRMEAGQVKHGRHHVDELDRCADGAPRGNAPRIAQKEGNVNLRLEDLEAVDPVAVFAKALAVVGSGDDDGVVLETTPTQVVQDPANLGVGVGNFPLVE